MALLPSQTTTINIIENLQYDRSRIGGRSNRHRSGSRRLWTNCNETKNSTISPVRHKSNILNYVSGFAPCKVLRLDTTGPPALHQFAPVDLYHHQNAQPYSR